MKVEQNRVRQRPDLIKPLLCPALRHNAEEQARGQAGDYQGAGQHRQTIAAQEFSRTVSESIVSRQHRQAAQKSLQIVPQVVDRLVALRLLGVRRLEHDVVQIASQGAVQL